MAAVISVASRTWRRAVADPLLSVVHERGNSMANRSIAVPGLLMPVHQKRDLTNPFAIFDKWCRLRANCLVAEKRNLSARPRFLPIVFYDRSGQSANPSHPRLCLRAYNPVQARDMVSELQVRWAGQKIIICATELRSALVEAGFAARAAPEAAGKSSDLGVSIWDAGVATARI
jgi:hypothetical protein